MTLRHRREDADDEAFDDNGLLRDGKSVRVPLTMRDGDSFSPVQRAVALSSSRASVTDASGGTIGLHRPGFRIPAADAADAARTSALEASYDEYQKYIGDAWRTPSGSVAARTETPRDQRSEQQDHQQTMDEIYAAHDETLRNAWRSA
jgi:hypothetical protein